MKNSKLLLTLLLALKFSFGFSQVSINSFLKPSDTLNKQKRTTVIISESILASTVLVGLNQLWYADYPKSSFHFINDNNEWLQMDKAGHLFSSYQLGNFGVNALKWAGCNRKSQIVYGATAGFVFLTAVEVFDGYSSQWGASSGDIIANATGTTLFISQELLWKEQRIVPKFSFHTTQYASARPNALGSSITEQVLKDYNGQTYWLSANLYSFFKQSKIPKWLNLAVGYGADGMISGNSESSFFDLTQNQDRKRQFYLSFDADLTKIKTKNHLLKTVFSVINTIKIPAPTIEIAHFNDVKLHLVYF